MDTRVSEALDEDRAELRGIASSMESAVPQLAERLGLWHDFLAEGTKAAVSPLAAEDVLEQATRALRHIWLQAAASSTSKSYRSPTEDERTVTPVGRFHNFGYERDLQPDALVLEVFRGAALRMATGPRAVFERTSGDDGRADAALLAPGPCNQPSP